LSVLIPLLFAFFTSLRADETVVPEPIPQEMLLSEVPYVYGGIVVAHFAQGDERFTQRGSGCIIGENLVITAAHVLFDESNLIWAGEVEFYPRFHKTRTDSVEDPFVDGYLVWDDYEVHFKEHGNSTFTAQLDVAILYIQDLHSSSFPPLNVLYEDEFINLTSSRSKLVTGYPQWTYWEDFSYVKEENDLAQHRFGPWDFWIRKRLIDWPDEVLGRTYWYYIHDSIPGLPRNSGGPLFIQEDDGRWACSGFLIRGNWAESGYRVLGEDVLDLIQQAKTAVGDAFMMPIRSLDVRADASGVILEWEDTGDTENGYEIWTQALMGEASKTYTEWKRLDVVGEDVTEFHHAGAKGGFRGFYKVRPYQLTNGYTEKNYGPFSRAAYIDVPGQNHSVAEASGEKLLHWTTGGWTNAQAIHGETGKPTAIMFAGVNHGENAWAETKLMGPGTLHFAVQTSTERNYDVLELSVNGLPMRAWSGETPRQEASINLAEGLNRIRWTYSKDKDFTDHRDRAYLHSVEWEPENPNQYLPGAYAAEADSSSLFFAPWFGWYDRTYHPWIYHYGLGWLYISAQTNGSLYAYRIPSGGAEWLYLVPDFFPWAFSFKANDWIELKVPDTAVDQGSRF
jgi:hypothetical protein